MSEKRKISGETFGEERALYAEKNISVENCAFAGPEDGESALKEVRNVNIADCDFQLRYPLWHAEDVVMAGSKMSETCRAAMWYDDGLHIENCEMNGIKALRECKNVVIRHSSANSMEYGWFCRNINVNDFELTGEYPFMHSENIGMENFRLKGKYSFQYVQNVTISNSVLDTKDAFWHSRNVTVYDSVVKGEYLAWYSEGLKLVRCKIIGTQPLCYCKDLVLEDCEMVGCDLSFENSEVTATVKGHIDSIKNPVNGSISADSVGELILDEYRWEGKCPIVIAGEKVAE